MGVNGNTPLPELPAEITEHIEAKAWQLVNKYGFTVSDWEDITQDLTMKVLRRRVMAPPGHEGDIKLLVRLVRNAVSGLLRPRKAAARDWRRNGGSLERWKKDEKGRWVCLEDTVVDGRRVDDRVKKAKDFHLDLEAAVAALPERLAVIYRLRLAGHSVQEVAGIMGRDRSSIYDALQDIKRRFIAAGLKKYFTE